MVFTAPSKFLAAISLVTVSCASYAQDAIERTWYNHEKTGKVKIFKATDGKYYGKLVWLKVAEENGKPRVDKNNPDAAHRNDPLMGMQLLKGFTKDDDRHFSGGTIYDPKNGKTYSCKITRNGNTLDVRGYVGISLIGRTTTWTLVE